MATISRLSVSLSANTTKLKKGLKSARNTVKRFTGQIFSLKGAIAGALGIGSLGALTKSFLSNFEKQEQAVAKVNAAITSMGRTTKNLSGELQALASQIQSEGILGDEAILDGQSFLLTYGKITDELLPRATRLMADLAAKMGGGPNGVARAANMLGKASEGMVGTLALAGISLSDATKESKNFLDIMTEIEAQVGGTNKALGSTASGGIQQFKNALGDITEKLGGVISIAISPFLRKIGADMGDVSIDVKKMAGEFQNWILTSARSMAPLMDALAGLNMVWKGLKLAAAGFWLLVLDMVKGITKDVNRLAGVFGVDLIDPSILDEINRAWDGQMETVRGLQKEIADYHDEIVKELPSAKIKIEIDKFALDAELQLMKQRIGFVEGGTFAKQDKPPKQTPRQTGISDSEVRNMFKNSLHSNPQIDATNSILNDINNTMSKKFVAVAG